MRFTLLGPVTVDCDGELITVPAGIPRTVLVRLLLSANKVRSTDQLAAAAWADRPRDLAVESLRNHMVRLRRLLGPAGARIRTHSPGYLVEVHDGELDLHDFEQLCERGRELLHARDWASARSALAEALGHWHGPPLAETALGADISGRIQQLSEAMALARQGRIEADLALGRHLEVIGELRSLADDHPLHEPVHTLLMLALRRSGRTAEALEVFHTLRRALVEELGLEPAAEVQEIQRRILTADPGLAPDPPARAPEPEPEPGFTAAGWIRPAQLPACVVDFTGRGEETEALCRILAADRSTQAAAGVAAVVVTGCGGIGKTALALHVAHRLADEFPDGQLYVDLRGADPVPSDPGDVLAQWLHELTGPGAWIPAATEARATHFRSLLNGRRLLLVLDNARDAAQLRPLIPGSAGCRVLVTSRYRIPGLEGARHLELPVLSESAATGLLTDILGGDRAAAEPEAVRAIVACCAGLPLALRIAGSRLAGRVSWNVEAYAARLADEGRRLGELVVEDLAVRAGFEVSYESLAREESEPGAISAARAFRLLGLATDWIVEISLPAAQALLDCPDQRVERILESLVDAHLLETPEPGRYRFHDLIGLYARERAEQDEGAAERRAAIDRLLYWFVATASSAGEQIHSGSWPLSLPPRDDTVRPIVLEGTSRCMAWYEKELANIVKAAEACARRGLFEYGWMLAAGLWPFMQLQWHPTEWLAATDSGLRCARELGDHGGRSRLQRARIMALLQLRRASAACDAAELAIDAARAAHDVDHEIRALQVAAIAYTENGRPETALDCIDRSTALSGENDTDGRRLIAATNSVAALQALGRRKDAFHAADLALALCSRPGNEVYHGAVLGLRANLMRDYDDPDHEAVEALYLESMEQCRAVGDHARAIEGYGALGLFYLRHGRIDEALANLRTYRRLAGESGTPAKDEFLGGLRRAEEPAGDPVPAA
jgi:DNA-binding SARP family transcriptional activator/tetratricopeptide (TPR) repeat protein